MGRGQNVEGLEYPEPHFLRSEEAMRVLSWEATLSDLLFEGALWLPGHRGTGWSESMCAETGVGTKWSSR